MSKDCDPQILLGKYASVKKDQSSIIIYTYSFLGRLKLMVLFVDDAPVLSMHDPRQMLIP